MPDNKGIMGQECRPEGGVAGAAHGTSGSGCTAAHGFLFPVVVLCPTRLLKEIKKGNIERGREKGRQNSCVCIVTASFFCDKYSQWEGT